MLRWLRPALPSLLAGVLLAACGVVDTPEPEEVEQFPVEPTPGGDPFVDEADPEGAEPLDGPAVFDGEDLTDATMTTRSSPLGAHLVDGDGRTLYVFTSDLPGERTCTDECLQTWPVFSTDGVPSVDGEAREDLVGTIAGDGGGEQVTYNEMPLYYHVDDATVGDLTGHGVAGDWFLVAPEGYPIVEDQG
jgi:predicted lipoprotein with Yx(FWY)xxD motif